MSKSPRTEIAPDKPQESRKPHRFTYDGRAYALYFEDGKWRLRSKSARTPCDYRTGIANAKKAEAAAKDWLKRRGESPVHSRKGGGTLEGLVTVYLSTPKRTKTMCANNNVSRLRGCVRLALGKELAAVTCREIHPEFWRKYQKEALDAKGHAFDLTTRRHENVGINSAVTCSRAIFIKSLLPHYRAAGLDVRPDAGEAVPLPVPYAPPKAMDDDALVAAWEKLKPTSGVDSCGESPGMEPVSPGAGPTDIRLWLAIGLARFAGMRRLEICHARGGWVEDRGGVVSILLRDRPEEAFWTKTGKHYRANVIHPDLAAYLRTADPEAYIVPGPPEMQSRLFWFLKTPQAWLKRQGITAGKPLHRLRGAYADAIAALTADAVTARLAGVKAAQENLGHTSSAMTEAHYLTPQ